MYSEERERERERETMSGLDRDLGTCQFRFKTVTNNLTYQGKALLYPFIVC